MGDTKEKAWREIGEWRKVMLTEQWQTIDLDLSTWITAPGQYEVELRTTGGQGSPEVQKAMVVIAGTEAPRLITQTKRLYAWILSRTDQVTDDAQPQTTLRLRVRNKKTEVNGRSEMYIRCLQ
jgi:hypothetical protein